MAVNRWLFKEEPTHYSFSDLVRDGETTWSGVSNALALIHLRKCKSGDQVFFYHTGKEKAIVGIMEIVQPKAPQDKSQKEVTVTVKPILALNRPVSLLEIRSEKTLTDWELAKISRLSIMPVTKTQWQKVMELADKPPKS